MKKINPTVFSVTIALLVIFYFINLKWLLIFAIIIGLIGFFSEWLSDQIEKILIAFSVYQSKTIHFILLSTLFYLILYPISILYKRFNKDPLMLSKKYNSFFVPVETKFRKEDMEKTW